MHEVLFRGKEVADGKWIEGFYSAEEYNPYSGEVEHIPRIQIIGKCVSLGVIPETVGQYTGLTDKNGVRIFEGDIVRAFTRFSEIYVSSVAYHDGTFWFKNWSWTKFLFKFEKIEVIGNIHDNPEILNNSSL